MLSERQEKILLSLSKLDYLTVKQFQKLHDLKSDRNAYRVIKQLESHMNVFKDNGVNVYYLNKQGREAINCSVIRAKLTTAQHYLMRNDLYIHLGGPKSWNNEQEMKFTSPNEQFTLIADAYYSTNKHHLIEIDHMQQMSANKKKIDKYRKLIQYNAFKGIPKLIWVTTTEHRKKRILELCKGLDVTVYLPIDLK